MNVDIQNIHIPNNGIQSTDMLNLAESQNIRAEIPNQIPVYNTQFYPPQNVISYPDDGSIENSSWN